MSLPPLVSFSELMPFFSPCILLSWALLLAPDWPFSDSEDFMESEPFVPDDSAPFMPDLPESWLIAPDEAPPRSEEDPPCCAEEPADGASRPPPVPCAFAKPVPAIRAAAATEIKKRLVIEFLLTCFIA